MRFLVFSLFVFFLASCFSDKHHQQEDPSENTDSQTLVRTYSLYGIDTAFMREYGELTRIIKKDSTILEYCKDSVESYHYTGKTIRNNQRLCFPKEYFGKGKILVPEKTHKVAKVFRGMEIKRTFELNSGGRPYQIFEVQSIIATSISMDTILMRSKEFWNEELGSLLRFDENIARKKRRLIKVEKFDKHPGLAPDLLHQLCKDSSTWITRNPDDGKLWF